MISLAEVREVANTYNVIPVVKRLFNGDWPTKLTRCNAGALAVFNGRRSLHRVRNVFGKKMRIMSVLSYAKTEGEDLDDNWGVEITRLVYFNDLDKANKSFAESCEDYDLNIQV